MHLMQQSKEQNKKNDSQNDLLVQILSFGAGWYSRTPLLLPLVSMQREEGERRWRSNKGSDNGFLLPAC